MGMMWDEFPLPGIADVADALGKSTGVVSSVQLSHATPGAVWSHQKNRNMYADIANEMIYNSGLDVIMGCGDPMESADYKYVGGKKTWADIIDKDGANGFFLMIEGGAVDWKNHANDIGAMVKEQAAFNDTVAAVKHWVEKDSSWQQTLVIVTSDHECGMLWGPGTYTDNDCGRADKCKVGYFDAGVDTFNGWMHIKNNGKNQIPGVQYGSKGHTRALVPVFAKGVDAEMFFDLIDGVDTRSASFWGFSGQYIDNTDIYTVMEAAMNSGANHSKAIPPAP
jgi:alkaline phosphatase